MARITPLEAPFDAEASAVIEALGPPISLFRVLARRPDRARGIHGWGRYYLSRRSALTLRHREMAILRTTALCGAEYEWSVHVQAFAERAGLSPDQVASLTKGDALDECWADHDDKAVLRAIDALHVSHDLSDAEWDPLHAALGDEAVIDLLLLCGWYHAISYVARAVRLPLEPDGPTFAEPSGGPPHPDSAAQPTPPVPTRESEVGGR